MRTLSAGASGSDRETARTTSITLLRREGWKDGIDRVYRLYRLDGLSVRSKPRKKRRAIVRVPPATATAPRQRCAIDFVHDTLADARPFRVLSVVDVFSRSREVLEPGIGFTGARVAELLERAAKGRLPEVITADNGTEFTSKALAAWAFERGVKLDFIRPGKPTENGFVESFQGRFRDECLNTEIFESIDDAKKKIGAPTRAKRARERRAREPLIARPRERERATARGGSPFSPGVLARACVDWPTRRSIARTSCRVGELRTAPDGARTQASHRFSYSVTNIHTRQRAIARSTPWGRNVRTA